MLSHQQIGQIVTLSRQWRDRSPDRILFEHGEIDPEIRRQVALQVALIPKMQRKMPLFMQGGGYVPRRVNFEQSSSELAAQYKLRLLSPSERILDMTGGLGIDAISMSSISEYSLIYDIDPIVAQALTYNLQTLLHKDSIAVRCGDALKEMSYDTLEGTTLVYADPARRAMEDPNQRQISMDEYTPSPRRIIARLQELGYNGRLLLKLSPMLDVHWVLAQLPLAYEMHIVQVQDEVKELLVLVSMQPLESEATISLSVINRLGAVNRYDVPYRALSSLHTGYATRVEEYIQIPQPVLMKSSAYHWIAEEQKLKLLGPNTHIYTSHIDQSSPLFRSYRVLEEIGYTRSTLRGRSLQGIRHRYPALTIMSRHFPLTALELKKVLKTEESDTYYLLATTLGDRDRRLIFLSH
jgi:hypothetical protein